jgi:acetoin utilization deacetylase AcuC-like enzyme
LIPIYYSPDYTAAHDDFDTTRKATWVASSLIDAPLDGVSLLAPSLLTAEQITTVHDPAYVQAVWTGRPRHLAQSTGIHWDPKVWLAVRASNGGGVAAALAALRSRRNAGSLSSGLHHASRGRGMGSAPSTGWRLPRRRRAITEPAC